jgi:PPOX class probable F420-dependent enzyme
VDTAEARRRFAGARVARLATAGADAVPHLVPVTFALVGGLEGDLKGDTVVFAVDHKPKSTTALRRLAHIAENPAVAFLADHYDDDWTRLWWVRADGVAEIVTGVPREDLAALAAKYPQYAEAPPEGPVVRTSVHTWRGWSWR